VDELILKLYHEKDASRPLEMGRGWDNAYQITQSEDETVGIPRTEVFPVIDSHKFECGYEVSPAE
jgi:hypothetical protein